MTARPGSSRLVGASSVMTSGAESVQGQTGGGAADDVAVAADDGVDVHAHVKSTVVAGGVDVVHAVNAQDTDGAVVQGVNQTGVSVALGNDGGEKFIGVHADYVTGLTVKCQGADDA